MTRLELQNGLPESHAGNSRKMKKREKEKRSMENEEESGSNSPLPAESLADALLSVPVVQPAALSLPRLRRDIGLKSSFPSG